MAAEAAAAQREADKAKNPVVSQRVYHMVPVVMLPRIPLSSFRPPPFRPETVEPPSRTPSNQLLEALLSPRYLTETTNGWPGSMPPQTPNIVLPGLYSTAPKLDVSLWVKDPPAFDGNASLARARVLQAKISLQRTQRLFKSFTECENANSARPPFSPPLHEGSPGSPRRKSAAERSVLLGY